MNANKEELNSVKHHYIYKYKISMNKINKSFIDAKIGIAKEHTIILN